MIHPRASNHFISDTCTVGGVLPLSDTGAASGQLSIWRHTRLKESEAYPCRILKSCDEHIYIYLRGCHFEIERQNCQLVFLILPGIFSQTKAAVWSAEQILQSGEDPRRYYHYCVTKCYSLKDVSRSTTAGENPFSQLGLKPFELATEFCLKTNIWWNMIRIEGGEVLKRVKQRNTCRRNVFLEQEILHHPDGRWTFLDTFKTPSKVWVCDEWERLLCTDTHTINK